MGLDVGEPAQAERRQDTVPLARNKPLLGHASDQFHSCEVVLGCYFDPKFLMECQANKLCQFCYFHLQRLRKAHPSITNESLLTLVTLSLQAESITVMVSSTGRVDIFLTDFNPS